MRAALLVRTSTDFSCHLNPRMSIFGESDKEVPLLGHRPRPRGGRTATAQPIRSLAPVSVRGSRDGHLRPILLLVHGVMQGFLLRHGHFPPAIHRRRMSQHQRLVRVLHHGTSRRRRRRRRIHRGMLDGGISTLLSHHVRSNSCWINCWARSWRSVSGSE